MNQNTQALAKQFKALSDPLRIQILLFLQHRELCACDLLERLPIAQSTLSHHMKILCENEMVTARKTSRWTHYKCKKTGIKALQIFLSQIQTD